MPANKSKPIGRTPWDLASDLLARKSVLAVVAIIGWALLCGIGYLWFSGKVGLTSASQTDGKSERSPYVHWWSVVTDLPLQKCGALTREVYELTGTVDTENPDVDETSVAQVGVAGSVTSVIVCVRTGEKTTVMVISSGPDHTITKNREAQLREAVQAKLRP